MPLELPQQLKLCPKCGAGYLAESTQCDRCGVELSSEPDIDVLDVQIAPPTIFIGDADPPAAKKLPDRMKICPGCGEAVGAILTVCPECKHRLPLEADIAITDTSGLEQPSPLGQQGFSLWMLFVVTTAVAVACALGAIHPILGILFAITAGPALVWSLVQIRDREAKGQTLRWSDRANIFLVALAVTIGIVFAAAIGLGLLLGLLLVAMSAVR
jgi:hypothetical protein